jgi:SNF5 / SMARCB1 / INI1
MELYPIRIDVSYPPLRQQLSSDQTLAAPPMIRIIDTLVIDPNILKNHETLSNQKQLFTQWAHSIVTDAFVVGVTKSTTGGNQATFSDNSATVSSSITPSISTNTEFTGRYTIMDTTAVTNGITSSTQLSSNTSTKNFYESLMQQTIHQIQSQYSVIYQYQQLILQFRLQQQLMKNSSNISTADMNHIVPIRLRMELPSSNTTGSLPIRFQDDFQWDILSSNIITPIHMAQSIVQDLQLPYDAIPIITIHVLEQIIHSITDILRNKKRDPSDPTITTTLDSDLVDDDDEGFMMGPIPSILVQQMKGTTSDTNDKNMNCINNSNISAAWEISHSIHATNMLHFETLHKGQHTK